MAEEVAHMVELGSRLQEAARELSTEIMKVQILDAGMGTRRPPGGLHGRNALPDLVSEHEGIGRQIFTGRIGAQHLEHSG